MGEMNIFHIDFTVPQTQLVLDAAKITTVPQASATHTSGL